MVHFQNTGTATAENVVVKDTLDDNLDWSTLLPVYMSAQGQVTLEQVGSRKVATFTFNNINLPTATSEPVTSNGLLTYSIRIKSGMPIGTQFKNQSSIYFDYNEPVRTNQTLNTLGSSGGITNVNMVPSAGNNSFSIFPNPANNSFNATINSDFAGAADMKISDISGKALISKTVVLQKGAQTMSIDISQLSPGIYFVNLSQNGTSQTQKLVVIKS